MPQTTKPEQLPLLQDPTQEMELLVLTRARRLYMRSRVFRERHASFEALMEHPVAGRCVRMVATALVRSSQKRLGQ